MNDWPIFFTSSISWLSIALLFAFLALLIMCLQLKRQNQSLCKSVNNLENQLKAMSSGHLGMGREIKRVFKQVENVGELRTSMSDNSTSEKTYEQAALLLSRGATIEEVVEACDITPSEAELLAIMSHSAPSHTIRMKERVAI